MLILALDTSGFSGSVALLDGPCVLAERLLDPARRSAQTLAPGIDQLLAEQGRQPQDIGLVAVTTGPGSFTGLRVGVTTAKTLAYAVEGEVLGLSTLETIAHQVPGQLLARAAEIFAVMDAQRHELFVGQFHCAAAPASPTALPELVRAEPDKIVALAGWVGTVSPDAWLTGTGLERVPPGALPQNSKVVPNQHWTPLASTVGQLAWRDYSRGRRDDLWKLAPVYLRPSYAEEKAGKL